MGNLLQSIIGGGGKEPLTSSLFDLEAVSIDGKVVPLSQYRGQVSLIVNTASKCGFTKQYEDLETLYQKYRRRGFVVLGFPSNDFMGQEPGTDEEIRDFCLFNYGVTFPLFTKGPVTGANKQSVYRFLTEESGYSEVRWNFEKFLLDSLGEVVAGGVPLFRHLTRM